MATAVVGWRLGINPFDQPNVESAKVLARKMVKSYETSGALPPIAATGHGDGLTVYRRRRRGALRRLAGGWQRQCRGCGPRVSARRPARQLHRAAGVRDAVGRDDGGAAAVAGRVARPAARGHDGGIWTPFSSFDWAVAKGDAATASSFRSSPPHRPPTSRSPTAGCRHLAYQFGVLKVAPSLGDRQALLDAGRRVLRVEPDHASDDFARLTGLLP